jgi:hypothetical protein
MMRPSDLYTDWRIIFGLALILLGAGNWAVGLARTSQYAAMLARVPAADPDGSYRSFDALDSRADVEVLTPFNPEQRRISYATARMDFYHATFITGQMLVVIGLVIMLTGGITVIQRDARRALRRLGLPTSFRGDSGD